ncbi:5-bromo-4-chloroindolyl phosphate hydrolysis family protein [Clostridium pasteurianum]|uniref:5-bromo-4-chloroindolyl phosphate hydrolysis protein n=1 Tax=Clostridium pasteurianum BC1 TaxID=86416 RepID=R4KDC9_CLOPA|nr:5-bromo-4-chloroindolyl phosphate hydrolysis family protein [Clostridium pasteurianum]AGK98509.1 5-bromo-4-chloroindolyl phosphate hydrolysis protein [Clostridium pasteurianum BC1]
MSKTLKEIVAGLSGGIIFIIFYIIIHVSLVISIAVGVAAYIGITLIAARPTLYGVEMSGANGALIEQLKNTIDEGYSKVTEIKRLSKQIKKVSIKNKIDEICTIADKIFQYLKENPKRVSNIRRFLNYYLDAMINILKKYISIYNQEVDSAEITHSLSKVEELLDTVKKAFTEQQEKLLSNDMDALDTEIELFKDIMKSEGFDDEK